MAWRRRAIKWLLCLSALIASAILSVPLWVGPLVAWQVSTKLARPVTIGHLSLRLNDPLIVVADDVVIGNPDGFAREMDPFARISRLTVGIDLLASVHRRALAITAAEFERPMFNIVATSEGRENFRLPSTSNGPIGTLSVSDGHAQVSLATLRTDYAVTFATEDQSGGAGVTRIVAEARGINAGEPLLAHVVGVLPADADDRMSRWPVEIAVQNGPTRASVRGILQGLLDVRGVSADFMIVGPDMALLRSFTGVPFPVTQPYHVDGKLNVTEGVYQITNASGRLGRSELDGMMSIQTRAGQRPEIKAKFHSPSLDLHDIVSLLSGKPGAPETVRQTPQQQAQSTQAEASPRLLPQAQLYPDKLDLFDLHLSFDAEQIQGELMPFDNLTLALDIESGAVAVHRLSIGVGEGRISGDIQLTPQADKALRTRLDLKFQRLDVARLLWASGRYRGNGALNGAVRMEGTGHSIAETLASADGAASLWMAGGNLNSLLVDLAGLRLGSALLSSMEFSPTTRVDCFVANLPLRRGILSTHGLLLETADAVTEGTGVVDLRLERVEVRLQTQSKHFTVGVLPAPLLISGTLKQPHAAPDPAAAAGRGGLAGALALLPAIQLGIDNAGRCRPPSR